MERWLYAGLVGLLLGTVTSVATAQDSTTSPNLGGRLSRFREEQTRPVSAQYLIYKRAQYHAQQRAARLEAQRWAGYSPNRPVIPLSNFYTDVNPGLYKPWVLYYGGWVQHN